MDGEETCSWANAASLSENSANMAIKQTVFFFIKEKWAKLCRTLWAHDRQQNAV